MSLQNLVADNLGRQLQEWEWPVPDLLLAEHSRPNHIRLTVKKGLLIVKHLD